MEIFQLKEANDNIVNSVVLVFFVATVNIAALVQTSMNCFSVNH